MSSAIVIKPSQLAGTLRAEVRFVRGAMRRGAGRAARRGKVLLIERANAAGKTYLGQFRNSFHVADGTNTVTLYNDAPHAGIIELGARPRVVRPRATAQQQPPRANNQSPARLVLIRLPKPALVGGLC